MGKQNQEIGWNRGGRVGGIQIRDSSCEHTDDFSRPQPQVLSDWKGSWHRRILLSAFLWEYNVYPTYLINSKAGVKRSGKYFINDNAFLFGNNSLRRGEEFKDAGRKQLVRAKPDRGSPLRWRSTVLLRETKATNADAVWDAREPSVFCHIDMTVSAPAGCFRHLDTLILVNLYYPSLAESLVVYFISEIVCESTTIKGKNWTSWLYDRWK